MILLYKITNQFFLWNHTGNRLVFLRMPLMVSIVICLTYIYLTMDIVYCSEIEDLPTTNTSISYTMRQYNIFNGILLMIGGIGLIAYGTNVNEIQSIKLGAMSIFFGVQQILKGAIQ